MQGHAAARQVQAGVARSALACLLASPDSAPGQPASAADRPWTRRIIHQLRGRQAAAADHVAAEDVHAVPDALPAYLCGHLEQAVGPWLPRHDRHLLGDLLDIRRAAGRPGRTRQGKAGSAGQDCLQVRLYAYGQSLNPIRPCMRVGRRVRAWRRRRPAQRPYARRHPACRITLPCTPCAWRQCVRAALRQGCLGTRATASPGSPGVWRFADALNAPIQNERNYLCTLLNQQSSTGAPGVWCYAVRVLHFALRQLVDLQKSCVCVAGGTQGWELATHEARLVCLACPDALLLLCRRAPAAAAAAGQAGRRRRPACHRSIARSAACLAGCQPTMGGPALHLVRPALLWPPGCHPCVLPPREPDQTSSTPAHLLRPILLLQDDVLVLDLGARRQLHLHRPDVARVPGGRHLRGVGWAGGGVEAKQTESAGHSTRWLSAEGLSRGRQDSMRHLQAGGRVRRGIPARAGRQLQLQQAPAPVACTTPAQPRTHSCQPCSRAPAQPCTHTHTHTHTHVRALKEPPRLRTLAIERNDHPKGIWLPPTQIICLLCTRYSTASRTLQSSGRERKREAT